MGLSRELQFEDDKISDTITKDIPERNVAKTPKFHLQEIFEDQTLNDRGGLHEMSSIKNHQY